jgi:hypothetical protein
MASVIDDGPPRGYSVDMESVAVSRPRPFDGRAETRSWLVAVLLTACAGNLASENVTLTTYYPAPSGVYGQMITTNNTYLARDGGQVSVGASSSGTGQELDVYSRNAAANNSAIRATYPAGGPLAGTEFAALANRSGAWSALYANQGSANYAATINGGVAGAYALTPQYAGWNSYGTGAGGAAIYNDNAGFKTLMIVGNNSSGGARNVSVWDNLTVNGILYPGCYQKAFSNGGAVYCNNPGSERAVAFDYTGDLFQLEVMSPAASSNYSVNEWFYTSGSMLCCRIHE